MSALLKHYEKVKAGVKTAEEEEQEAKERVLADKNPLRQGGYNAYMKVFDDDPYKYTNAEKSVLLSEFNPAIGTATLGIDSKQAFEDRRNVEGVIYGGGAFLSALGLGVVAKPISRGLGKVARFFSRKEKDIPGLDVPSDYETAPDPFRETQDIIDRQTGQELFSAEDFEMTSPSYRVKGGPSMFEEAREAESRALTRTDEQLKALIDKESKTRTNLVEYDRELDTSLLENVDPVVGGLRGETARRTSDVSGSTVPSEKIGEFYSPVSRKMLGLTPDVLRRAGIKVNVKELPDHVYTKAGLDKMGITSGKVPIVKLADLKSYFRALAAKGEISGGEYEYLVENKLFDTGLADNIVASPSPTFESGRGLGNLSQENQNFVFSGEDVAAGNMYVLLPQVKNVFRKEVEPRYAKYNIIEDKKREGGKPFYATAYGQRQSVLDPEIDYAAVTFNTPNLGKDLIDTSKHQFREDSLGHVRMSLRDGTNSTESLQEVLDNKRFETTLPAEYTLSDVEVFRNDFFNISESLKMLEERSNKIKNMNFSSYPWTRSDNIISSSLKEKINRVDFSNKDKDSLATLQKKLMQNEFDEIIEGMVGSKGGGLDKQGGLEVNQFNFILDSDPFLDLEAFLKDKARTSTAARTGIDLDYKLKSKVDEKLEIIDDLSGNLLDDVINPSSPLESSNRIEKVSLVNDIIRLANNKPMDEDFKDNVAQLLIRDILLVDNDYWNSVGIDTDIVENFQQKYGAKDNPIVFRPDMEESNLDIVERFLDDIQELDDKYQTSMGTEVTSGYSLDDVDSFLKDAEIGIRGNRPISLFTKKVETTGDFTYRTASNKEIADDIIAYIDSSKDRYRGRKMSGTFGNFVENKKIDTYKLDQNKEYFDFDPYISLTKVRAEQPVVEGFSDFEIANAIENMSEAEYAEATGIGYFDMPNGEPVYGIQVNEIVRRFSKNALRNQRGEIVLSALASPDLGKSGRLVLNEFEGVNLTKEGLEVLGSKKPLVLVDYPSEAKYKNVLRISPTISFSDLKNFDEDLGEMVKTYNEKPEVKRIKEIPQKLKSKIDEGKFLKEKYFLIEELQSDLFNQITMGKKKPTFTKQDFPLKTHTEYTTKLLQAAIAKAKKQGVNKIVIPAFDEMAKVRTGGMPYDIIKRVYRDGVRKSVDKLTRESNNTIKASKADMPHLESRYSEKVNDIKEATVIDITDFDFDPSKGDIFKFNEGGYVGNVDSQMSELFN
tara:strand:+ start:25 stop:3708 length:3684 start_codon:yes stop_codon:yes gene_type:complete